jgi:hypothetical protein
MMEKQYTRETPLVLQFPALALDQIYGLVLSTVSTEYPMQYIPFIAALRKLCFPSPYPM